MRSNIKYLIGIMAMCCLPILLSAQGELDCDPLENQPISQGDVQFNFGSVTNSFSFQNKSSYTIGQPLIGTIVKQDGIMQFGFWATFLLPPSSPQVTVTKGDFPDRVLIQWSLDPLSPEANNGYFITRDGAFLATVDETTNQFIDFNVQAGEIYEYGVYGKNIYGNGTPDTDLGFVNPNGTVTGIVKSFSGNPVPGAIVSLSPSDGTALVFDGVDDHLCVSYDPKFDNEMLTVSAWVKIGDNNDKRSIVDFGSQHDANISIKTTSSAMGKGVVVGAGDGSSISTLSYEFTEDEDGWHQVAAVYTTGALLLYVDGNFINSVNTTLVNTPSLITIGSNPEKTEFFKGSIDDVRVYNRSLTGSEILITKNISVSRTTPGLVAYWKFDEGRGEKTFDISNNGLDAFINGATFTDASADIINAGMTDEGGFYSIDAINYSTNQNFTATPSKIFYSNYALEFNGAYSSYVDLPKFDLPDSSSIELVVLPFDNESTQCILNNGTDNFNIGIEAGMLQLTINGETQNLTAVQKEYQHLAFVIKGDDNTVDVYKNGVLLSTLSFVDVTGDWSSSKWTLGSNNAGDDNFFSGLIDEVSFYKNYNSVPDIQLHAATSGNGGTDVGNENLLSYFDLNEGVDTIVYDSGPAMTGNGKVNAASYTRVTRTQEELPHLFTPSARVVNMNSSNTAASGIDFTDESTIPVSGVIRFEGTFCFQDSVEILVNGESNSPRIFTDNLGRFVVDLEPGTTATLSPLFGEGSKAHFFTPATYKVIKLNRPISNTLFANQTKRTIVGQISGGDDRLAVNAPGDIVKFKVESVGPACVEEEIALDNISGNFKFENLPAIKLTTSLSFNTDINILDYFQLEGGKTSDVRNIKSDTLDFRYFTIPTVEMEEFPEGICPNGDVVPTNLPYPYIYESGPDNGFKVYDKDIRMFEQYAGGKQYLENFDLIVTNNLNDESADTILVRDTSTYNYKFVAGQANIGGDFTKFLQVEGVSARNENDVVVERVIVLGERERETTYATTAPQFPLLILRDPPGDKSSAKWEKGKTYCTTWSGMAGEKEGGGFGREIKLGPDIEFSTGIGVSKTTKLEIENTVSVDATFETSEKDTREAKFCMTANETITTSDTGLVPTEDGDVYFGVALNMKFSGNDVLYIDKETCTFKNDSLTTSVVPEGFETEYIYSGWQLKTVVIPNLELIGDNVSADAWRAIIDYNEALKQNGFKEKNISFDGLASYTETRQVEQSASSSFEFSVTDDGTIGLALGYEVDGIGDGIKLKTTFGVSSSETDTESNTETSSVSYTLADDDPNDSYTVDVLTDPVMGTPYFQLAAGESMCPWIPGTLNREEIGFQIDRLTAVNIPENEAAVFRITMSNLGQTNNDAIVYQLGLKQGSNANGAKVKVDGVGFTNPIAIQLQPEESKEFLISITKGDDINVFNYSDIGIFVSSKCQYDHSLGLGYNLAAYADWEKNHPGEPIPIEGDGIMEGIYNVVDLQKFYKQFSLNVEFIEPCSRVNIGFPLDNWVQTPVEGDDLSIVLNDYNNTDPDLDSLRLQYRKTGGNGIWKFITEIPKADLTSPISYTYNWDISDLLDGPYDIRALAICLSGLDPGISSVVRGRKETLPPEVFGTPQPSDGILGPGDDISIEFTKRINCDEVNQADGNGTNINLNNIALQDMTLGGILVGAVITCKDGKISIVPNVPNQFIENHVLRVTATNIEDLYGNQSEQTVWEFIVNRSNLHWVGGDVDEVTLEGEELTVVREIRNQSGEIANFELYDIPDWLQVFPNTGTLAPGVSIPVTFTFDSDLVISTADYEATINLSEVVGSSTTPIDGNEPLNVSLRIACPKPEWSVQSSDYSFSMNFVLQLDIEGELSTDRLDIVGAFVDGELRGLANVEYVSNLDKYMAFLTTYSNDGSGEIVEFQIWDASTCQLFANIIEEFPFTADDLIGTPNVTQIIHTDGQVLRKIDLHTGWNWISFNLNFPDDTINSVLSSLTNPSGGYIKGQGPFSNFSDSLQSWNGTLNSLGFESLYQYKSASVDSISMIGFPINSDTPIPLMDGWNWIGYLPQIGLPINDALASLDPSNGDVIKSQISFAVFIAGVGWIGNLDFLSPPNGYLLNLSGDDILVYPNVDQLTSGVQEDSKVFNENNVFTTTMVDQNPISQKVFSHWVIDPTKYEHSMNVIGIVLEQEAGEILNEGDEIAAFVDSELRGSSVVTYIPSFDKYMTFITLYANEEGETLNFKLYDASENDELDLVENMNFMINKLVGSVDNAYPFHLKSATKVIDYNLDNHFKVSPNPFANSLLISFETDVKSDIELIVTDILGRVVHTVTVNNTIGKRLIDWIPEDDIVGGSYFVTLRTSDNKVVRKVLYIK